MKKISLFLAALFCIMTMSAKTIYCKMEHGWWKTDGAAVGCYYWEGTGAPSWPGNRMTPVEGEADLWSYELPGDVTTIIFTRVNGSGDIADWGAKTANLTVPTGPENLYTITSANPVWRDPGVTGVWSVYGEPLQEVAVESVTLSATTLTLAPAAATQLKATINPATATNQKVIWSSSAEDVVSVNGGTITALKEGSAKITVTTEDGGKTASCDVTVVATANGITVHFTVPEGWGDAYVYAWTTSDTYVLGAWPGSKITTQDEDGYYVTFDGSYEEINLIINNNNAGKQTADIVGVTADACYTVQPNGEGWKAVPCEGTEPNPTPTEYYLIGFINGANHGDGDDYANLGDYKFMGDPLQVTATFTETSYVCVKTGDPQVWYMATEYVDATTLLEGSVQLTVSSETINEKMGVPGGQELTFTLVENEDGTLTLSFITVDTSDLEYNMVNPSKARKIVIDGQIYILRDGVRYNVLGAQVQ